MIDLKDNKSRWSTTSARGGQFKRLFHLMQKIAKLEKPDISKPEKK